MSGTWNETPDSRSGTAEKKVKYAALDSFSRYRRVAQCNVTHRRRQNFYALPQAHSQLLTQVPFCILDKFNKVDAAIEANAIIASEIAKQALEAFEIKSNDWQGKAKSSDLDKARSTIRQFYRDWSVEGVVERRACYDPVLGDLRKVFNHIKDKGTVKVLVPGAGLGRLVVEVCAAGFDVEGNELSYHQLMASNWILNGVRKSEQFDLYPWALTFANQVSRDNQVKRVKVPDVHAGTFLAQASKSYSKHPSERMRMSAADFCSLYALPEQADSFHAVTTVYFIDTAPNLIWYIEAIRNVLVVNGYWINLGPLLWHIEGRGPGIGDKDVMDERGYQHTAELAGIEEPGSVELIADEVLLLVENMGFEVIERQISSCSQGYIQDPNCMITTSYKVLHFIARKRGTVAGL